MINEFFVAGEKIRQVAINSTDIKGSISEMELNGIKNIAINSEWGYKLKNIDFIENYPWIEGVTIIGDGYNITSLKLLQNLKFIQLNDKFTGELDMAFFQKLNYCSIRWTPNKILNLHSSSQLKYLALSHYSGEDLKVVERMKDLINLKLYFGKMKVLDGVEKLKKLQRIDLYDLYSLEILDAIGELSGNLTELFIENCKKISSYTSLLNCKKLETLYINNSAPIESIATLTNLKRGYIGVEILDRNVGPLKDKKIEFKRSKSYS